MMHIRHPLARRGVVLPAVCERQRVIAWFLHAQRATCVLQMLHADEHFTFGAYDASIRFLLVPPQHAPSGRTAFFPSDHPATAPSP